LKLNTEQHAGEADFDESNRPDVEIIYGDVEAQMQRQGFAWDNILLMPS
jgi:hypothetical protein